MIVGDPIGQCHLALFSDADVAGDLAESKSTNGCYIALIGPNTFAPLGAASETQTCVSHSSTESEMVALDFAIRTEGLPLLSLVLFLAGVKPASMAAPREAEGDFDGIDSPSTFSNVKGPQLIVYEDNEAVIEIVRKKRSLALRSMGRTRRVVLDWLYEQFEHDDIHLRYIGTEDQTADMMTKGFTKGL